MPETPEIRGWKRDYLLLWTVTFAHLCAANSFLAFPLQLLKWNYSVMDIAWLAFAMDGTLVAIRPGVKWFLDAFRARSTMLLSSVLLVLAAFLYQLAGSHFRWLVLAKMTHGISLSFLLVAYMVYASHLLPSRVKQRYISWLSIPNILPQFVVLPWVEWLIRSGRLPFFFGFIGFCGLVGTLCSLLLRDLRGSSEGERPFAHLMKDPRYSRILALVLGENISNAITQTFASILAAKRGFPVSGFFAAYSLGTLVTRGALAGFFERFTLRAVIAGTLAGLTLCLSVIVFTHSLPLFILASLAYGLCQGPLDPALLTYTGKLFPFDPNAAFTGYMTAQDIAWASAPLIGGPVGNNAVAWAFVLSTSIVGATFVASIRWVGSDPGKEAEP